MTRNHNLHSDHRSYHDRGRGHDRYHRTNRGPRSRSPPRDRDREYAREHLRDPYRPQSQSYGDRNSRDGRDGRNGRDGRDDYDTFRARGQGSPTSTAFSGRGGDDRYRPPQGDFTFRVDKPAGVQESDTYRPQNNSGRNDRRRGYSPNRDAKRNRGAQNRRDHHSSQPFGARPRRPMFIAAERELLKVNHETGNEQLLYDPSNSVQYRPLDELTDSEAESNLSNEDQQDGEPAHKRARLSLEQSASDNNVPKWSNPDPYTALPIQPIEQKKKKDVVQLIRKARIQPDQPRASLPADLADFIALDDDDEDEQENTKTTEEYDDDYEPTLDLGPSVVNVPSPAPNQGSHIAPGPADQSPVFADLSKQTTASMPATASGTAVVEDVPVENPQRVVRPRLPRGVLFEDPTPAILGNRKRTWDDEIKVPHATLKKASKIPASGEIVEAWRPRADLNPIPWFRPNATNSGSINVL
jgi:hypothetical protein